MRIVAFSVSADAAANVALLAESVALLAQSVAMLAQSMGESPGVLNSPAVYATAATGLRDRSYSPAVYATAATPPRSTRPQLQGLRDRRPPPPVTMP